MGVQDSRLCLAQLMAGENSIDPQPAGEASTMASHFYLCSFEEMTLPCFIRYSFFASDIL
jgi:hypothetical protein